MFIGIQVIVYYLKRGKRPSATTMLIGLVLLVFTSGILVLLRSPNAQEINVENILEDNRREILDRGPIFGLMNVTYVFPDKHTFLGARIFRDLIIMPIPRALWPEKPALISQNAVMEPLLPIPDSHSAGLIGVYFAHFGFFGVVGSFALGGAVLALAYSLHQSRPKNEIANIFLAGMLPSIYILMIRSNPTAQVTYVVYFFAPAMFVVFVMYQIARVRNQRFRA